MKYNKIFAEKCVMITCADSSTGAAVLNAFAAEGACLIAHAWKKTDAYEEMLRNISKKYQIDIYPVYFDPADYDAMKCAIQSMVKEKKFVDVLINNCGMNHAEIYQMTTASEIREAFESDLFRQMELTQMVLRMMVRKRKGSVVNIAAHHSGKYTMREEFFTAEAGHKDTVCGGSICENTACRVSDEALSAWTKTLAAETGRQGIRVNAVVPGPTDVYTDRDVSLEETTETVMFLASDRASFVNGQIIKIGKNTAWNRNRKADSHVKLPLQKNPAAKSVSSKQGVLITGAAGGFGLAVIKKLCERKQWYSWTGEETPHGQKVIVACAHQPDKEFEKILRNFEQEYDIKIMPQYIELSDERSIHRLSEKLISEDIRVDVLVNNAGIAHGNFFQMTKVDEIRRVYDINLVSHILLTNLILKDMIENSFGVIVNVSSIAGITLASGNSAYGTSKAAIIRWTKELAEEFEAENIYAFAVAPGLSETRMRGRMEEKAGKNMMRFSAMQRLGKPEEIAEVIAEGIIHPTIFNGQVIRVDGGENYG